MHGSAEADDWKVHPDVDSVKETYLRHIQKCFIIF